MPVTVRPQPEQAGYNKDRVVADVSELFDSVSTAWCSEGNPRARSNKQVGPDTRKVLRHSFDDLNTDKAVASYANGFVEGIRRAFQQDLHLVLCPDDVWLAILVQFSAYVNGHAEELRSLFVSHEEKKKLVVVTPMSPWSVDMHWFALEITNLMGEFFNEPDMKDWLIPTFSTTTHQDSGVAAMAMMATMKSYFEYVLRGGCGFPSVTLQGTKADWVDLRARLGRFTKYGPEPTEWVALLDKVLKYMVSSFDEPESCDTTDFWMRAVHEAGGRGSGDLTTMSGWLTAFCFWDEEGKRITSFTDDECKRYDGGQIDRKRLVLDGVSFPIITPTSIPSGICHCQVAVQDLAVRLQYNSTLVAGTIGMSVSTSPDGDEPDTFQPRSGWWLLLDKIEPLKDEDLE